MTTWQITTNQLTQGPLPASKAKISLLLALITWDDKGVPLFPPSKWLFKSSAWGWPHHTAALRYWNRMGAEVSVRLGICFGNSWYTDLIPSLAFLPWAPLAPSLWVPAQPPQLHEQSIT